MHTAVRSQLYLHIVAFVINVLYAVKEWIYISNNFGKFQ